MSKQKSNRKWTFKMELKFRYIPSAVQPKIYKAIIFSNLAKSKFYSSDPNDSCCNRKIFKKRLLSTN